MLGGLGLNMKKLLFVCNMGRNRSRTAAELYKKHYYTKSAGIFEDVLAPLAMEKLEWADIVFVMEEEQLDFIREKFPTQFYKKRIVCLDIPDIYVYMTKPLELELREKVGRYLK